MENSTAQQQFSNRNNHLSISSIDEWIARSDEVDEPSELVEDFTIPRLVTGLATQAYGIAKHKVQGAELVVAVSYLIATQQLSPPQDTLFTPGMVAWSHERGTIVEKPAPAPELPLIEVPFPHLDFGADIVIPEEVLLAIGTRDAQQHYWANKARKQDMGLAYAAAAIRNRNGFEDQLSRSTPVCESTFGRDVVITEDVDAKVYRRAERRSNEGSKALSHAYGALRLAEEQMREHFNPYTV